MALLGRGHMLCGPRNSLHALKIGRECRDEPTPQAYIIPPVHLSRGSAAASVAASQSSKRVNAHLAAAAYPVLEGRGELLSSRLKQE